MDDEQTQQFFTDRNAALADGSLSVVRAFAAQYNIPTSPDDRELTMFIANVRVLNGISTGGDYYRDQLTLSLNGLPDHSS